MFKKIFAKIRKKAKIASDAAHFSWKLALFNLLPGRLCRVLIGTKHKIIMDYLCKNYSYVIEKYKNIKIESVPLKDDCPIFVCWLQGEEAMPPVVKACFASIKRFAQNHPVVLITSENFSQYVTIPDHILRKVSEGKITLTHFSDIIRVNLLAKYNAIWLDATIYLTAPLNWPLTAFHTLKEHKITGPFVSCSKYSSLCKKSPIYIRWTTFCIAGEAVREVGEN